MKCQRRESVSITLTSILPRVCFVASSRMISLFSVHWSGHHSAVTHRHSQHTPSVTRHTPLSSTLAQMHMGDEIKTHVCEGKDVCSQACGETDRVSRRSGAHTLRHTVSTQAGFSLHVSQTLILVPTTCSCAKLPNTSRKDTRSHTSTQVFALSYTARTSLGRDALLFSGVLPWSVGFLLQIDCLESFLGHL